MKMYIIWVPTIPTYNIFFFQFSSINNNIFVLQLFKNYIAVVPSSSVILLKNFKVIENQFLKMSIESLL